MGVAEEAEGRTDVAEGLVGVVLAEDVEILVERGAVADGEEVLDRLRALRQGVQEVVAGLGHGLARPADGGGGDGVERLDRIVLGDGLVVVAADDGQRLQAPDDTDDLVGRGAVADQVAQADVVVDAALVGQLQDGGQGFQVAVDVAEDQNPHQAFPAAAARPSCSLWAWKEERTRGPDSTPEKPRARASARRRSNSAGV